ASSQDIRLTDTLQVASAQTASSSADRKKLAAYYAPAKGASFSQRDFEALLGRPVPPNQTPTKGNYTFNTPIGDMQDSFIARQLYGVLSKQMAKMVAGQEDTPMGLLMNAMMKEMPLRSILMFGGGSLNRGMLEALLVMINGKFFKGAGALIKALFNK
ncbi:MAG TPA: hypothetical protein DEH25_17280, partial [Chloroflexi bacterium]|nr:hypothetical protein [Chloroflexota bacterium]